MRVHAAIHVALMLLYFLPGGLLWNHVEPLVFGLPFSVFMWWLLLPLLILVNMAVYVRGQWAEDKLVSTEVRRRTGVAAAETPGETQPAPHTDKREV